MCRCLQASRAGYYRWVKNGDRDDSDLILVAEILDVMKQVRWTYGVIRMTAALKKRGFHINKKRVERLMREHQIRCKKVKKFKKTTNSKHDFPASEDRLQRRFKVTKPNRVWVSDITYLKTRDGWLYLCTWLDLFSRKVVGWSISPSLASSFVCEALSNALMQRPGARPLIHSDRGIQYASKEFRRMLWKHKLRQSMSRKGNCWDNAVAESLFSTIKSELESTSRMSGKSVREAAFEYLEVFYNRKRLHSTLGYKTPSEVEKEYWSLTDAAQRSGCLQKGG